LLSCLLLPHAAHSRELGALNQGLSFCKDICGYHNRFK
jgi:hypothetical protein